MKIKSMLLTTALTLSLTACGSTKVVDLNDAEQVSEMKHVMELEYRDWTATAEEMTESMLKSGAFKKQENPVIAIADIENDTLQRIDPDILIKKIRTTLVNDGTAQITTGFQNKKEIKTGYLPVTAELNAQSQGVRGNTSQLNAKGNGYMAVEYEEMNAEDDTTHQVRDTRGNDEYDQSTIAKKGTLVAPNMSLSGKMIQRNLPVQTGWFDRNDTRVEYYLQLTLTNVNTGLSVWEDEKPIVKEGTRTPNW